MYVLWTLARSGCIYSKVQDLGVDSPVNFLKIQESSKKKLITWPWQLTLNVKVKTHFGTYDLSYLWLHTWYRLDLDADSNYIEANDLE